MSATEPQNQEKRAVLDCETAILYNLTIMRTAILTFTVALFFAVCSFAAGTKPNIIFILADDLGYGDLSCYGQEKFTTPNIDRLASEGMKFTQFYAGSTVCAPSRCSLMTGYHTGRCYIRGNRDQPATLGNFPIPPETVTVAKVLKKAGYATGCFGKWGLGGPLSEGAAFRQGFDIFFGYYDQRHAHNHYPDHLYKNEQRIELDGKTYSHDLMEKEALDFIRANKDKPFFCYMPITIPHAAMQAPEEFVAPWREKFPEFEDTIGRYTFGIEVRNPVAAFPGMINRFDLTVKRVLELLKELDLDENTIIMLSSDNGPHQEAGHRSDLFQSSGPLRGIKRDFYEGGIRMPTLVRWAGTIKPGSVSEHIGAFWDVLPTFAELAGVAPTEYPDDLDGVSFLPTLLGNTQNQKQHPYLYWEFFEQGGKIAARFGKWKGIQLNVNETFGKADAPIEVYDLENDLGETTNVAAEQPAIVKRFQEIFQTARTPSSLFRFPAETVNP